MTRIAEIVPRPLSRALTVGRAHVYALLALSVVALTAWIYLSSDQDISLAWDCTPIDTASDSLEENPCFRAIRSAENEITLEWRVASASQDVYIYDVVGPNYSDIGLQDARCYSAPYGTCAYRLRVHSGGFFRWTLEASGASGEKLYASASIELRSPFPPAVTVDNVFVDVLDPSSRAISWVPDKRNEWQQSGLDSAWIEVLAKPAFFSKATRYPRFGAGAHFTVPESDLAAPGSTLYDIRDCHLPAGSDTSFCSDTVTTGFYTGADYFLGHHAINVATGMDVDVNFTARAGDVRRLSLFPAQSLHAESSFVLADGAELRIPAAQLAPGVNRLELTSCQMPGPVCADVAETLIAEKDSFLFQMPERYYSSGTIIAVLFPKDGSGGQLIRTPRTGLVKFPNKGMFISVQQGEPVAQVIAGPSDELFILVDSKTEWELGRAYTDDFQVGVAYPVLGSGEPLDVTYDLQGGKWLLNEFSGSVEHVSSEGEVATLGLPLARHKSDSTSVLKVTTPFALSFQQQLIETPVSALAERVTRVKSEIWLTQGGGMLEDHVTVGNHSRIIAIDQGLTDLPTTPYDDRLCVYNVPADDANGFGNNQVTGLAFSKGRIWFAESRGFFGYRPSVISSFIPDREKCINLLDFDDPEALAAQKFQYCTEFTTPEQDGCIQRYSLAGLPAGIKPAHLESDPLDGSIWFTDARGEYLGNLNPDRSEVFKLYPLVDSHAQPFDGMEIFGGLPWNIRVDEDAVYFGEYATHHLLRFDKATSTFDEIHVPCTSPQVRLHSIDLDRKSNRLWFTLTNEVLVPLEDTGSTIGYVDLNSWRVQATVADSEATVRGVVYKNLGTIIAAGEAEGRPYAFRGIAVDPATGNLALASMWRRQLVELKPHSGFWP